MSVRDDMIAHVGNIVNDVVSNAVVGSNDNKLLDGLDSKEHGERRKQIVSNMASGALQSMSKNARELYEAFNSPSYGPTCSTPGTSYTPGS